jgi:hypothetical protein
MTDDRQTSDFWLHISQNKNWLLSARVPISCCCPFLQRDLNSLCLLEGNQSVCLLIVCDMCTSFSITPFLCCWCFRVCFPISGSLNWLLSCSSTTAHQSFTSPGDTLKALERPITGRFGGNLLWLILVCQASSLKVCIVA